MSSSWPVAVVVVLGVVVAVVRVASLMEEWCSNPAPPIPLWLEAAEQQAVAVLAAATAAILLYIPELKAFA